MLQKISVAMPLSGKKGSNMFKVFTVVGIISILNLILITSAFADQQVMQQVLTVKERVRLNLWYQGVSLNPIKTKSKYPESVNRANENNKKMSVELETAIGNMDI